MFRIYGELINDSGAKIKLVEVLLFDPPGSHGRVLRLLPGGRRLFLASEFSDRNHLSGRPSVILVYVDGVEARSLRPEHFKRFIRMRFLVDGDGNLAIRGVEAEFSDHFQFW